MPTNAKKKKAGRNKTGLYCYKIPILYSKWDNIT